MSTKIFINVITVIITFSFFQLPSHAQILIGQTAGFSGVVSAGVKETTDGAKLYIDVINKAGGVAGQQIELISLDDKFDVKLAAENARILIEEKKVSALFLNRGTPHTEAILPLLSKHGIALLAPSTGAMLLHKPVNPYVFNVRSSYQREAEKAVAHQVSIGMQRFAVVHVDDSFGNDALRGAENGFKKNNINPVGIFKIDRDKPDYAAIVPNLVKSNAQVVFWFGSGSNVSNGVKALRAADYLATVVTLSNNASLGFIKQLDSVAQGVVVTQVFPSERSGTYAMVRQAKELGKAAGIEQISPQTLEGFAAAKVLVEALRRAGKSPTRAKIVTALDSIKNFDVGGMELSYSPSDHSGLDFADLSIIGKDGRFMR